jgi:hypothetical protein
LMDMKHVFTPVNISFGPRIYRIILKSLLITYFRLNTEIPKCLQLQKIVSLYHILSDVAISMLLIVFDTFTICAYTRYKFSTIWSLWTYFWLTILLKFLSEDYRKTFFPLFGPCIQIFKSS